MEAHLEEGLSFHLTLLEGELDVELLDELGSHLLLEVHDGIEDLEDGIENEGGESTSVSISSGVAPLLLGSVVEVVAPETVHELGGLNAELGGIHLSEVLEGEGPSVQTRAKTDGSNLGVDLDHSHGAIVLTVCGNNHVHALDDTLHGWFCGDNV